MEKPNNTPGEKRGAFTSDSETATELLSRLNNRLVNDDISPDVMPEWLDNVFRYEAVPDNNIIWGRTIRDIAQYISTADMADSFAQSQWRCVTWGDMRVVVQISTVVDENFEHVDAERQRLQRYFDSGLMEEPDIRGQLWNAFIGGVSAVTYQYFVHADDIGRPATEGQIKQGYVFADGSNYVKGIGTTEGIRVLSPDVSIAEYEEAGSQYQDFIAKCQANTLFNESLWNDLEQVAPIPAPLPNNFV
jgi:hypothetical protein